MTGFHFGFPRGLFGGGLVPADLAGITANMPFETAITDGFGVNTWPSGTAAPDAVIAADLSKPAKTATGILFDGINDELTTTNFAFVLASASSFVTRVRLGVEDPGVAWSIGSTQDLSLERSGGAWRVVLGGVNKSTFGISPFANWTTIMGIHDGANIDFRMDTEAWGTAACPAIPTGNFLNLGRRAASGQWIAVEISDLYIWAAVHTREDIEAIADVYIPSIRG